MARSEALLRSGSEPGSIELAATLDGGASAATPLEVQGGARQVGRFLLLRLLGAGGMGEVHVAFDERLDRRVAIKLLHTTELQSELLRQRVLREAQAMARVSHENVVPIYEVGEADEQVFIAMEYVEGTTLKEWQRQARPWPEVLRMYLEAGRGLRAAHAVGLIHRDFKADNVLIGGDGRPRVADFGLARLGDRQAMASESAGAGMPSGRSGDRLAEPLTVAGAISGTPGYMSPEQYQGGDVDARSDQFSFCASLFEALYGGLPYRGDSLAELAKNTLAGQLPAPPAGTQVPPEVHSALVRGLAVDPAGRYPSMAALLAALALEEGHSAAGVATSRRRASYLFALAIIVLNFATRLGSGGWSQVPTVRSDVIAAAVAAVVLCGLGVGLRKTLYQNAFHRRVFTLGVVILWQKVLLGGLAVSAGLPFRMYHATDLVTLAAAFTLLALAGLRALAWVPPVLLLAAGALAGMGDAAVPYSFSLYPVIAGATVIAWTSAAERAHRESLQAPGG